MIDDAISKPLKEALERKLQSLSEDGRGENSNDQEKPSGEVCRRHLFLLSVETNLPDKSEVVLPDDVIDVFLDGYGFPDWLVGVGAELIALDDVDGFRLLEFFEPSHEKKNP